MYVVLPSTTISLHKLSPSLSPSPLAFAWRRKMYLASATLVYRRPLASGYLWIRLPGYRMRLLAIIISGKRVGFGGECSEGSRDSSVWGWARSLEFDLEAFSIHLCIALTIRRLAGNTEQSKTAGNKSSIQVAASILFPPTDTTTAAFFFFLLVLATEAAAQQQQQQQGKYLHAIHRSNSHLR